MCEERPVDDRSRSADRARVRRLLGCGAALVAAPRMTTPAPVAGGQIERRLTFGGPASASRHQRRRQHHSDARPQRAAASQLGVRAEYATGAAGPGGRDHSGPAGGSSRVCNSDLS